MTKPHRSGFVNIIGRPNVGKSTIVNALTGRRFNIVTHKPQTTRHRILAILSDEHYQLVLSDTPGVIEDPGYELHRSLNNSAYSAFEDADVLIIMTDDRDEGSLIPKLEQRLLKADMPIVLVINKMDRMKEGQADEIEGRWRATGIAFHQVYRCTALDAQQVEVLKASLIELLPIGPAYYPKDQLADRPDRFFVSEIIREELLLQYRQEIPYSCEVFIEHYKEDDDITRIGAVIVVAQATHKGIIIGKGGKAIKQLGVASRSKIEAYLQERVYLELHVKVKKNWRDDERMIKHFGY